MITDANAPSVTVALTAATRAFQPLSLARGSVEGVRGHRLVAVPLHGSSEFSQNEWMAMHSNAKEGLSFGHALIHVGSRIAVLSRMSPVRRIVVQGIWLIVLGLSESAQVASRLKADSIAPFNAFLRTHGDTL